MIDPVASGRIDIDINDAEAIAALRALDAQFDRTMRSIENKEAEVTITGNIRDLKRALKEAEALERAHAKKVEDLQEKQGRTYGAAKRAVEAKLREEEKTLRVIRAQIEAAEEQVRTGQAYVEQIKRGNEQLKFQDQRIKSAEAAQRRLITAEEKSVLNERASLRMRSEAEAMDRKIEHERATGQEREEVRIRKLQREYAKYYELHRRAERKLGQARTRFSPATVQRVKIDDADALAQMALLHAELSAAGAIPVTQHVDLKLDEQHSGAGVFSRFADTLTATAVRIGPVTTSIGALTRTLALLGPIITGVIGHLGAMAAAVGSGLAGALGVGSAAALGFGISVAGIGLALPKLLNDFKNLNTLQDAYHKQVLKTGANSEKAKTKLEEFEHALGEVPPTTLKTFEAMDKLSKRWGNFTETLRPQFFSALASSIDTISVRMGWFERNTATAFTEVTKGWNAWMARLRSDAAGGVLEQLGENTNRSIKPLMSGLGNLAAAFGRVAASFSRWLPELFRGFEAWSGRINDAASDTETLDRRVDKAVGSMRAFGHFIAAAGRWFVALFAPGVDVGTRSLEKYAGGLNRSAHSMRGVQREKIAQFFEDATKTSERFIKAIAPFAQIFFEWTTIMRPFTDVLVFTIGKIGDLLDAVLSFGPAKGIMQAAFAVFLYGRLAKGIVTTFQGLKGIYNLMLAMKAAGGISGALKGGLIKFVTGGAVRGTTPANPLFVMNVGPGGVGGKGPVAGPGGTKPTGGILGKVPGIAKVPAGAVGGFLALAGAMTAYGVVLDKIASKKNAEKNNAQLQKLIAARNIEGIRALQREYEKFGKTPPPNLQRAIDQVRALNNQDTNKLATNVRRNWDALLSKTRVTFSDMSRFADRGMQIIHRSVKGHSESSEKAARQNFKSASRAIKQAIQDGKVSSERGMREIHKLWVEVLKEYGFSPRQARTIAQGRGISGHEEGNAQLARGGVMTVGGSSAKGRSARDNVPAMLNGTPAVVAKGEQVAVFTKHQQKAMDQMHPGGLEGFFSRNRKPHYMASGGVIDAPAIRYAKGGIVPVPGFPGESAASSVIGIIESIARRFHVILTDAFGQGHKSPGHTVTGTAADFSGPDANMDRAVKWLTSQGYVVGYDGRFGSQNWPDHGPSTKTSNYHFHVELGGKGGKGGGAGLGMEAPDIKRVKAAAGLGRVTDASQAALDTARGAAQANLQRVFEQLSAPVSGGGGGVGGGKAASRSQMIAWAKTALRATGQDASAENVSKILELAQKESSWVVRALNTWDINAQHGNPSGGLMQVTLDKVGGSYERLYNPVQNMIASIRYQISRYGRLITFSPYAQGGVVKDEGTSYQTQLDLMDTKLAKLAQMFGGSASPNTQDIPLSANAPKNAALVGEGRGPELIADHATGNVRQVSSPTIMALKDSEAVIPSEPAYKGRGRELLESFAKTLGIPGFMVGKRERSSKNKKKRKSKMNYNPEKLSQVKRYRLLERTEDDLNARIEVADREVREPEDLVVPTGKKDEAGNDLYMPNTPEIESYKGQLDKLIGLQMQMWGSPQSVLNQLDAQFKPAMDQLKAYRMQHGTNKAILQSKIKADQQLLSIPLKGKNKKHLARQQKKARKRLEKNRKRLETEKTYLSQERDTRSDIQEDHTDLTRRRLDDARLDLSDQKRIRSAVEGNVAEALASANPSTDSEGTSAAEEGLSYQSQLAIADTMLADIAKEFGGNFSPNVQNIPLAANGPLAGAQGMQTNPAVITNPVEAAGNLLSAAGTLSTSAGNVTVTGSPASIAAATTKIASVSGASGGVIGTQDSISSAGMVSAAPATSGGTSGGTSKTVNITNYFQEQPSDPLTWTRGVEFEAGAAI